MDILNLELRVARNLGGQGGISEWAPPVCKIHPTWWYFCPKTKKSWPLTRATSFYLQPSLALHCISPLLTDQSHGSSSTESRHWTIHKWNTSQDLCGQPLFKVALGPLKGSLGSGRIAFQPLTITGHWEHQLPARHYSRHFLFIISLNSKEISCKGVCLNALKQKKVSGSSQQQVPVRHLDRQS